MSLFNTFGVIENDQMLAEIKTQFMNAVDTEDLAKVTKILEYFLPNLVKDEILVNYIIRIRDDGGIIDKIFYDTNTIPPNWPIMRDIAGRYCVQDEYINDYIRKYLDDPTIQDQLIELIKLYQYKVFAVNYTLERLFDRDIILMCNTLGIRLYSEGGLIGFHIKMANIFEEFHIPRFHLLEQDEIIYNVMKGYICGLSDDERCKIIKQYGAPTIHFTSIPKSYPIEPILQKIILALNPKSKLVYYRIKPAELEEYPELPAELAEMAILGV
jgi:hypothetical protein